MPTSIKGPSTRIAILLALLIGLPLAAQQDSYDLILTGGHVVDPANEIDGVRDVAIRSGRIACVAASLPVQSAKRTVDVKGLYVVPGLVDIHSHVYGYSGALFPDDVALPAGTTTVADAGGPGWRNFAGSFLWPVADRAMQLGFPPDTISTDIHSSSILGPQSDLQPSVTEVCNACESCHPRLQSSLR